MEPPPLGFSLCKVMVLGLLHYFPFLFLEVFPAPPTGHYFASFYFRIPVLFPVQLRLNSLAFLLIIMFTKPPSLGFSLCKVKVLPLIHKESSSLLSSNICYHETTKKRNENMHLAPSDVMESTA
uniref:Uncharacterized protein n=1 Tax=Arundo donax TaxID=35708 RepID=A0A0A9GEE2_ARUDO